MTRTDIHRPSAFVGTDYRVIGYIYTGDNPHDAKSWDGVENDIDGFTKDDLFTAVWDVRGMDLSRCDHCGNGRVQYFVIAEHTPTGEWVAIGHICANKIGMDVDDMAIRDLQRRAKLARERARVAAEVAEFTAAHPDVVACITNIPEFVLNGTREFFGDLARKLRKYGSLSDRQIAAVRKSVWNAANFAANRPERPTPSQPAPEGKATVTGQIVTTKWQENDFGGALKMVVRLDDGNAVWVTVPSKLTNAWVDYAEPFRTTGTTDEMLDETEWYVTQRITFTADFTRSDNDENFSFGKRPTGVRLESDVVPPAHTERNDT